MTGAEFFVVYPCFVVESPGRESLRAVPVAGRECLALFTDRDLAAALVEDEGDTGRLRSFRSPGELAEFLHSLDGTRFTHVAFDPVGQSRTFAISVDDLLSSIKG